MLILYLLLFTVEEHLDLGNTKDNCVTLVDTQRVNYGQDLIAKDNKMSNHYPFR